MESFFQNASFLQWLHFSLVTLALDLTVFWLLHLSMELNISICLVMNLTPQFSRKTALLIISTMDLDPWHNLFLIG